MLAFPAHRQYKRLSRFLLERPRCAFSWTLQKFAVAPDTLARAGSHLISSVSLSDQPCLMPRHSPRSFGETISTQWELRTGLAPQLLEALALTTFA